jgi:hypothetical protein
MATRVDIVNTDEALTVEERASAAARAKFAEWHRAELEQRPRRILFFAITLGAVIALAIVFLV